MYIGICADSFIYDIAQSKGISSSQTAPRRGFLYSILSLSIDFQELFFAGNRYIFKKLSRTFKFLFKLKKKTIIEIFLIITFVCTAASYIERYISRVYIIYEIPHSVGVILLFLCWHSHTRCIIV